jgi:LPXTG-site transpeptidase (sortase) family protein
MCHTVVMFKDVTTRFRPLLTLRRFNNVLTLVVLAFALYMVLLPFMPNVGWWIAREAPIISRPATVAIPKAAAAMPAAPTLIIPSLGMTQTIHESEDESGLNLGVWHRPLTATPEKYSNTVLAAHRHTRSGPGVFYHLDKLQKGDDIYVYWDSKRYTYAVDNITIVPPTEVAVEAPTDFPRLTLYTCTPLWSFKDRLVVQASLKDIQ